ncbi:hypothetical protein MMC34_008548 [Xylographa carneopallida]|nr:hypothetical protein [Xylographa carneopallida]
MSDSALFASQPQTALLRGIDSLSHIHGQHFDVAVELAAANASIHDGRLAQLTPAILMPHDAVSSYPFLQGGPATYRQPFDFNPAPSVYHMPVQPFHPTAEGALPMPSRLAGLGLRAEVPTFAAGELISVPNSQKDVSVVPSTYGSYVAAFEVRELSAYTFNLKQRFGDIVGSAHDACHNLLDEMTQEFIDVMDQIRGLASHEIEMDVESLSKEFTNDRGLPAASGPSPPPITTQRHQDQDLIWQASILKGIYRRRDLMVQHINLLSRSRIVGGQDLVLYLVRKLDYGLDASFLDCLQIEAGEWKHLWDSLHIESERVKLTKERLSTFANLWGVHLDALKPLKSTGRMKD